MPQDLPLTLGNFHYYPKQQKLTHPDGLELKLRPQSLAVLHFLSSRPNEIVSKDEIFQTVWKDVSVTDDSLVQCIADIRRVLGDKKHQILQTVPRRGYKLVLSAPFTHEEDDPAPNENNSKVGFARWSTFSGLTVLLSIVMIAGVSWFVKQDNPVNVTAEANQPPSLFLDVFSSATSAQGKRVETETKVALGRYRTIRLINVENADYQLTLEIDDEQVTAELTDTSDDSVAFLDSFPLTEDQQSTNNTGIRIAAAIASPGGGAIGRRLLAQSRNRPVEALTPQECYSHAYNCPTCSGEEDTLTHRSNTCISDILAKNPKDALAWALRATILTRQLWFGVSLSEKQRNDPKLIKQLPAQALEAANRAEALANGDNSGVYWGMAQAYVASCELDKLKVAINRGLEINPDDPNLLAPFGNWLAFTGSWEEGSALSRKALEIEPQKYKPWWWQGIAKTHFQRKEYAQSLEAFLKSYNERSWLSRLQLAYTLPYVDRVEDAQKEVQQLLEMLPDFNREAARAFYEKFCFPEEYIQRMDRGVALAGLPSGKKQKTIESSPSISVLPFKNLTDNSRWGRLAEGLSTEIANELARNHWLFITAPTVFTGQSASNTDPAVIGRGVGSQFVLSGSVQAEEDNLRISARLTDVPNGKIIWAERWQRPATAIFAVQDEILQKVEATISGAWSGIVAKHGLVKARNLPTSSLDAYELFLLGTEHKHKFTPEHDEIAASYFNKAVEIDPTFSKAWATLAVLRANQSVSVAGKTKRRALADDRQYAALKAYELNPSDPDVLLQYSWLKGKGGEFKLASEAVHQAVSLAPNNPDILAHAAWVAALRNPESKQDGLFWGIKATKLSTGNPPPWYRAGLGIAAFYAEDLQRSLDSLKNAPPMADVLIHRAAAAALLGNKAEATEAVKRFNQLIPTDFTVQEYCELNAQDESSCAQLIKGAQLAGLPIGDK